MPTTLRILEFLSNTTETAEPTTLGIRLAFAFFEPQSDGNGEGRKNLLSSPSGASQIPFSFVNFSFV